MDNEKLTKRQQQILDYIRKCIEVKHYPPSVREIGQAIGLSSPSTVHAHLNALEAKGYIRRDGAKSRSMVITGAEQEEKTSASNTSGYASSTSIRSFSFPWLGALPQARPSLPSKT